jgi:hypothetical protein
MAFGSDKGTVYCQPVLNFGTAAAPFSIAANNSIRSSIAVAGDFAYFTSYSGTAGTLWQVLVSDLTSSTAPASLQSVSLTDASTSTPLITSNERIYVGTYNSFTSGTVKVYNPGTATTPPTPANTTDPPYDNIIYTGDPVQSSVIAYSDSFYNLKRDYIYFTTNASGGKGYNYFILEDTNADLLYFTYDWEAGGPGYAVQGFSSDGGYLVYGDDGNQLYIMHN